jgi:methyltransferase
MQGNAMKLPFDDNSFDIVINEAMLTMLPQISKEKAISEYFRVLKPG